MGRISLSLDIDRLLLPRRVNGSQQERLHHQLFLQEGLLGQEEYQHAEQGQLAEGIRLKQFVDMVRKRNAYSEGQTRMYDDPGEVMKS